MNTSTTTVLNSSNETLSNQIVPLFFFLKHNSLPRESQRYEQILYEFAKIINQESIETLRQIDNFFINIICTYKIEEASTIREILEQFCDFLESRKYILDNPFRQTNPRYVSKPCVSYQSPSSQVMESSIALQNEFKPSPNVIPFQRVNTPKSVDTHITDQASPSAGASIKDVQTPTLIKPLKDLIDDFLEERKTVGDYLQPNSLNAYKYNLKEFASFCEKNNFTLDEHCLKKFLSYLADYTQKNGDNLSSSAIQNRKSCLRSFIKYGIKNQWFVMSNEYQDILKIKKRERTPQNPHIPLTLEETNQLVEYVIKTSSPKEIMEILIPILCGPRAMETVRLRKLNFDLANYRLHLTITKNGIDRYVPLPQFIIKPVETFLRKLGSKDYIFPTRQSKFMTEKTLTHHIKEVAKQAGLNREVTSHDLRATFATLQFYNNNMDLLELQRYMGHDDINTTSGYISSRKRQEQKDVTPLADIYEKWENALSKRI